jgi:hypothetical protein
MSWWEIPPGDDVIGDSPADALGDALGKLRARTEAAVGRQPTLGELLGWLADALRRGAYPQAPEELVARTEGADIVARAQAPPEQELAELIDAALGEIAAAYDEAWDRAPRVTEVLKTLAFVLRPDPQRFVAENVRIDDIEGRY